MNTSVVVWCTPRFFLGSGFPGKRSRCRHLAPRGWNEQPHPRFKGRPQRCSRFGGRRRGAPIGLRPPIDVAGNSNTYAPPAFNYTAMKINPKTTNPPPHPSALKQIAVYGRDGLFRIGHCGLYSNTSTHFHICKYNTMHYWTVWPNTKWYSFIYSHFPIMLYVYHGDCRWIWNRLYKRWILNFIKHNLNTCSKSCCI